MRAYPEDFLKAKDKNKNAELIQKYNSLLCDVAFFEGKLTALQSTAVIVETADEKAAIVSDMTVMKTYIDTLKAYIESIKYAGLMSFKPGKMTDADMVILDAQVASVTAMHKFIENKGKDKADQLSQLINDAAKMEYSISYKKVWLRRGITLTIGLIAAGIAAAAVTLMSPAATIGAAVAGIGTGILAFISYLGIGKPVTTSTNLNVAGLNLPVSVAVPSTIGVGLAGVGGFSLIRKLRITNPVREESARNMQAATINKSTDELRKRINALIDGTVKTFLLSAVDKADRMYNSGVGSCFYESQQSKMLKARLILRETAKIIEGNIPNTVDEVKNVEIKVGKHHYTYYDFLNAHRTAVMWRSTSRTICSIEPAGERRRSVALSAIAGA